MNELNKREWDEFEIGRKTRMKCDCNASPVNAFPEFNASSALPL
jgi:hypothetical protein